MLALFIGMLFFCFVSCFLFLVSVSGYEENLVFPAILVFFELCWLKCGLFLCFMILFLFFLCCLSAV